MDKIELEVIGIIGAGTMGCGIAQIAAMAGHKTIIFDSNPLALKKASDEISKTLSRLLEKEKISAEENKTIWSRLSFEDSLEKLKSCSIIIEAIIEDAGIKQKLFKEVETFISTDCVTV